MSSLIGESKFRIRDGKETGERLKDQTGLVEKFVGFQKKDLELWKLHEDATV